MELSPAESWAAGFVESGAQVSPWKRGVSLRVRRKDPEPLYRLQEITGVGAVIEPREGTTRYTYHASNAEVVQIVNELAPALGASWLSRTRELLHRVLGTAL
jgi:hypothetical protein